MDGITSGILPSGFQLVVALLQRSNSFQTNLSNHDPCGIGSRHILFRDSKIKGLFNTHLVLATGVEPVTY
ncbi:MAG: hypothetical protein K0R66_1578 [Gammaproteobacteria bacterium]|nr:hypothetical protein [Gammaproteobacteria bacterium]